MTDLSNRQFRELFGDAPDGKRFVSIGNQAQVPLRAGDWIRVVAENEPSFLDSLWDSAQENAEEHTGELLNSLQAQGVFALAQKVQGRSVAAANGMREIYVYDFEVVEFFDPVAATSASGGSFAMNVGALAALVVSLGLLNVTLQTWRIKPDKLVDAANTASSSAASVAFWIGLAAVAVSIAYIVGKTKGAPSNG